MKLLVPYCLVLVMVKTWYWILNSYALLQFYHTCVISTEMVLFHWNLSFHSGKSRTFKIVLQAENQFLMSKIWATSKSIFLFVWQFIWSQWVYYNMQYVCLSDLGFSQSFMTLRWRRDELHIYIFLNLIKIS